MDTKNRSLNGKNIELNARFLSSHILNLNHIFLLKVVPANITNIQNLNMHSAGKFNAKSSSKIFQGHISEKSPHLLVMDLPKTLTESSKMLALHNC